MRSHAKQDNCLDEEAETVSARNPSVSKPLESVRSLTLGPKACREAHHAEVVECCFFAEPNSLKSWMGQNVKSPFSNIRAVTYRLYSYSTGIAVPNRPSRRVAKSP